MSDNRLGTGVVIRNGIIRGNKQPLSSRKLVYWEMLMSKKKPGSLTGMDQLQA